MPAIWTGSAWTQATSNARVLAEPVRIERQSDGRVRRWGHILEQDKYLRVVTPEDGEKIVGFEIEHAG